MFNNMFESVGSFFKYIIRRVFPVAAIATVTGETIFAYVPAKENGCAG
jgi:hypothetical protein